MALVALGCGGCKGPVEAEDITVQPPRVKGIELGDRVSDDLSELGVRTMRRLVAFLPLPLAPWFDSPTRIETAEDLGGEAALLGTLLPDQALFRGCGWFTIVYAPREGEERHLRLALVGRHRPEDAQPGAIVAAGGEIVLRAGPRPDVYVIEAQWGGEWQPGYDLFAPPDLLASGLLPALVPTHDYPTPLPTLTGTFQGVPVAGEDPPLYALPVFAGQRTPPALRGVRPVSPAVWVAGWDTTVGRRWAPLTWSPPALHAPAWRDYRVLPGERLAALLHETAPATPCPQYLVVQREDQRWVPLLAFAATLLPGALGDFPSPEEAVSAAEEQSARELVQLEQRRAEEAARLARERAQAAVDFDAALSAGDQRAARAALVRLAPGDAARWTRFVQTWGLEAETWSSTVDRRHAAQNGVAREVLDEASVEPVYEPPQSDWDYFWHGPRDGNYVPAYTSSYQPGNAWGNSPPPRVDPPTKGPNDDYYQRQYEDTIRRYSR